MPEKLESVLAINPPETERVDRQQALFDYITGPLRQWLIENEIDFGYLKRVQAVIVGSQYVLVLERYDDVPGVRRIAVDQQGNPSTHIEVYLVDTAPPVPPGVKQ